MFDFDKELAELIARRDRINEMKRMRDEGMTLQQIGDKYGLTRQRVFALIGKTGKIEKEKAG